MISDRKLQHLNLCLEKDVEYRQKKQVLVMLN